MFFILCFYFLCVYSYQHSRLVLLPGYGCCKNDYRDFITNGERLGVSVDVVPIERWEWLKTTKAIFRSNYWKYECEPHEMFDWYLQKSKKTLFNSVAKNNGKPVILCGHSAGGWLSRALMNDGNIYDSDIRTNTCISSLVTLGTPNKVSLLKDNTRGCLHYVNTKFPHCFLQNQHIHYVTVGSNSKIINMKEGFNFKDQMIKQSYQSVIGQTDETFVSGDGVVPLSHSHLKGSNQIVLFDVHHLQQKSKKCYWDVNVMKIWLNELKLAAPPSIGNSCRIYYRKKQG